MKDLNLFLQYLHTALTEQLWYNINAFNTASNGAIVLSSQKVSTIAGGIVQSDLFEMPRDMIRRRTPDTYEPLDTIDLANKMQNAIRIAWSTENLNMSLNVWEWIGRSPSLAGVQFGRAMAINILASYLKTAFTILKATVGANSNACLDLTTADPTVSGISETNLVWAADALGDAQNQLKAWIMPTAAKTELLVGQLNNQTRLYTIGSISVTSDVNGRVYVTSDDPNLRDINPTTGVMTYWVFGLVAGAISIVDVDDFDDLASEQGGFTNIKRGYQANWSSMINILNYNYDASQLTNSSDNKGKFASASDAALGAPQNWRQATESHKHTAGVALKCVANRPSYATPKMYNRQGA